MATKTFGIELEVNDAGAVTNINKVDTSFKAASASAQGLKQQLREMQKQLSSLDPNTKVYQELSVKAGKVKDQLNDAAEAVRANAGPAFETLGNNFGLLTSRLANLDFEGVAQSLTGIAGSIKNVKFADLSDGIKKVGMSFAQVGKALLLNPIFLIGASIALIVTQFDQITKLIDGVSGEQEDLLATQQKAAAASKEQLDSISQQENILKLQGKTEKDILAIKMKAVDAAIITQKIAIQTNENILKSQIEATKRNQEFVKTMLLFMTAPLQLVLEVYDKVTGSNTREKFNEFASGLLFDPKKVEEEGLAAIEEQKKALLALENQRAGFILQGQKADSDAAKERNAKAEESAKKQLEIDKKLAEDKIRIEKETQDALREARNGQLDEIEALQEEISQLGMSARENEIRAVQDEYFNKIETAKKLGLDTTALEEERARKLAEINKKYTDVIIQNAKTLKDALNPPSAQDEEIAAVKEKYAKLEELAKGDAAALLRIQEQKAKDLNNIDDKYNKKAIDQKIEYLRMSIGFLTTINESYTAKTKKQAKVQFEINKGLQIASAIIDTYKAATSSFASLAPIPIYGPVLGGLAAGAAIASGLANVNKIRQTKFDGNSFGGGGGGAGGGGGGGSMSTPSTGGNNNTPQFNPLDNQFLNNRPPQPVPAFILAGSAQTEQERRQKIEDLSRLN